MSADDSQKNDGSADESSLPLGLWLKEQRQKKKISLEEIAAVTKIHISQLHHLEEGKMDRLPAAAFVRGFLVSYARHLSLDENEVIARYKSSSGELGIGDVKVPGGLKGARSLSQPKVRMVTTPTFNTNSAASSRNVDDSQMPQFNVKILLWSLGGLLAVVVLIMVMFIGKKAKKEEIPAPSETVALSKEDKIEAVVPQTSKTPAPTTVAPAPLPAKALTTATAEVAKPGAAPALPKKHQLQIRALEQNWINIRTDDGSSQGIQLKAGGVYDFHADRKVVLSMSDAGALELKWDGTWFGAPGYRGDVKSLTFPEDSATLTPKTVSPRPIRPKPPVAVPAPSTEAPAAAAAPKPTAPAAND